MSADDCIFCKIVSGSVPCRRVLESDHAVAFLDVAPLAPGHCLLIPKEHYVSIDRMSPEAGAAVLGQLPRLTGAIRSATECEGFNVLANAGRVAGQEVMHAHVHVIPRRAGDGLGYPWRPQPLDDQAVDSLRDRIIAALGG